MSSVTSADSVDHRRHKHEKGGTRLHSAAQRGRLEDVREILDNQTKQNKDDAKAELSSDNSNAIRLSQRDADGNTALHLAAKYGHYGVVSVLLEWGGRPTWHNIVGNTVLHEAASSGSVPILRLLVDVRRTRVDMPGQYGRTALHVASMHGNPGAVTFLLDHGAKVDLRDQLEGDTPLHLAALAGERHVMRVLVDKGKADISARNKTGDTPLHRAAAKGQLEALRFLIGRHADIEAKHAFGWTPLHCAAANGQVGSIQVLVQNRANVSARDCRGDTPLHLASWFGRVETVRCLLDTKMASVAASNIRGQTPLHHAAWNGNPTAAADGEKLGKMGPNVQAVRLLLDRGADPFAPDRHADTALHFAAANGQMSAALALIRAGVPVDIRGQNGRQPLHMLALGSASIPMARLLIERGASVEARDDRNGDSPINLAAEFNKQQLAIFLLSENADKQLNRVTNRDGDGPLHRAAMAEHADMVQLLLDRGANVDLRRRYDGKTALHLAIATGNLVVVRRILDAGAKSGLVKVADSNGINALHIACRTGQIDLVELVLSKIDAGNKLFVNAVTEATHSTPLHFLAACEPPVGDDLQNYAASLRKLIDRLIRHYGADVSICDSNGMTPLKIAEQVAKNETMVDLLRKY